MVVAVASSVLLPLGVKADSDKFIIKFNNDIKDMDFKITYNANGGKFSDNSTKKNIPYAEEEIKKISHTENVDDTGKKLSNYGKDWFDENIVGSDRVDTSLPHIIQIPGATNLTIDIYYGGVDDEYYVAVMHDAVTDYNDFEWNDGTYHEYWTEQTGTFNINGNTVSNIGYDHFTIDGDTVSFGFGSSDVDVINGYGYYATIKSSEFKHHETITNPTREGFEFKGWYTDPDCTAGNEFDPADVSGNIEVYAKWKNPNVLDVGDEYCFNIGNECFYAIGYEDSTHVKLLSKEYLDLTNHVQISTTGEFIDFATSNYWSDDGLKSQYGTSYPAYVYDSNSLIYSHIEAYVDYLKTFNVNVTGRLITKDELVSIADNDWAHGNYWTGTAYNDNSLYRIYDDYISVNPIDNDSPMGNARVRPVIILEVNSN